jgi:hypothetical protein
VSGALLGVVVASLADPPPNNNDDPPPETPLVTFLRDCGWIMIVATKSERAELPVGGHSAPTPVNAIMVRDRLIA